jgi:hypothetical protein
MNAIQRLLAAGAPAKSGRNFDNYMDQLSDLLHKKELITFKVLLTGAVKVGKRENNPEVKDVEALLRLLDKIWFDADSD